MLKNKKSGFSLMEVLVAVSIMAVLAAFLVPSFMHFAYDARVKKDKEKWTATCLAFKKSMAEPEVEKEVEEICGNGPFKVVCFVDAEGVVVFGEGDLFGTLTKPLNDTELWLNTYQSVGIRYEASSKDYNEKYIVFNITPRTPTSVAACEYEVLDTYPI